MLRTAVAAGTVTILAAVALAQGEKNDREVHGTLQKVDAGAGTLTVKPDKETAEKEFTLTNSTKVVVFEGDDKRQWTGKKALKDEAVKAGRRVAVVSDADGKVTQVRVGVPRVWAQGTLKKVDPEAGTLTVTVKGKKESTDKNFTLAKSAKVVILDGKDRKELSAAEGLKDEAVKEGAEVAVATEGGKVVRLRVGTPPKKEK
jgi:hypothetical protein